MKPSRRKFLHLSAGAAALPAVSRLFCTTPHGLHPRTVAHQASLKRKRFIYSMAGRRKHPVSCRCWSTKWFTTFKTLGNSNLPVRRKGRSSHTRHRMAGLVYLDVT
jgi:hypothetical protein